MSDINVDPNLQGEKVVGLLDQFSDGLKNNHVQILETILILEQKFEVLKLESEASKAELQEERTKLDEKDAKIENLERIVNTLNDDLAELNKVVDERDQWRQAFEMISTRLTDILSEREEEVASLCEKIVTMSGGLPNEQIAVEQEVVSGKDPLVLSSEMRVEEPPAVPEEKKKKGLFSGPRIGAKKGKVGSVGLTASRS